MLALIVPIALFTALVLALSGIVLLTRRWFAAEGDVVITVNGRDELHVRSGEKLLWTLAAKDILLPAACGGRGSCGQCKVTVTAGGGGLLPTEANHIGSRDAQAGIRLACMLKVQNDLSLRLPETILGAQRYSCRVVSNRNLSTYLKELVLEADPRMDFEAGDYVLLKAPPITIRFTDLVIDPEYEPTWQSLGLRDLTVTLPEAATRAYSLANAPADKHLTLVVRIALPPAGNRKGIPPGKVSSYIFHLKPGDLIEVSGPYGDFHARESDREMVLIGGGAGVAPLRAIILDQLRRRPGGRKISFWYGARNVRELCYADEFNDLAARCDNFTYLAALSAAEPQDRWQGPSGFIHNVVYEHYLKSHPCPEEAEYYLCGPPLMSSAVLGMLDDLGVDRESVAFDDFGSP